MKNQFILAACVAIACLAASCEFDEPFDPNAPSINSVANDATSTQLNLLVSGLQAEIREGYETYVLATGSVARELYHVNADPRWVEELIEGNLDRATFYTTIPYSEGYKVVKNANILLAALENTSSVTDAEKQGYRGVANTFKAMALQRVLNMQGANGIRLDVADPNNLGGFLSEADALQAIEDLYDTGFTQLQAGNFAFSLTAGYADFDSPSEFAELNRALAARTNIAQRDWAGALEDVAGSYFTAGMMPALSPQFTFSNNAGDITNPLFRIPENSGNMIFAHPSWVNDSEAGDQRVATFIDPSSADTSITASLLGIYETRKFASISTPIGFLSNEELHLIRAEALAQTDQFEDAIGLIDIVRSIAGLPAYSGSRTDKDAIVDEVLRQRRYSLWLTGERFADLRRYNRLNATFLPIDRPDDTVPAQFPIPLSEGV